MILKYKSSDALPSFSLEMSDWFMSKKMQNQMAFLSSGENVLLKKQAPLSFPASNGSVAKGFQQNLWIVRFTHFNIFRGGKFHDSYICIKSNTSPLKWVQHANFLSFKKSYLIFWEYNVIAAFPTSLSSFQIFPYTLPFSFKFLASFENWCCLHICMHIYISRYIKKQPDQSTYYLHLCFQGWSFGSG